MVEDTSFSYFASMDIDKSKVEFKDIHVDGYIDHNLEEDHIKFSLLATINKDPSSFQEAMASPER